MKAILVLNSPNLFVNSKFCILQQIEDLEEKNEALMKENEKFRVEIQVVRAENNTLDRKCRILSLFIFIFDIHYFHIYYTRVRKSFFFF